MSEYDDIRHLWTLGSWPEGRIPEWAARAAKRLDTYPTNCVVLIGAMEREIKRLREENLGQRRMLKFAMPYLREEFQKAFEKLEAGEGQSLDEFFYGLTKEEQEQEQAGG